jgi:glycosyltransferase involved in cell wall biosynthesis
MLPSSGTVQVHCKTSSPAVSVILPAYNAVRYLRQAIDSILLQSYHDFELIVVDDASTDGTRAILNSYSDPRIVRLNLDKNLGIVGALNAALVLAKGAYIARMDSDDIAMPDRLQRQASFLDTNPDTAIVGSWIRGFGDVRRPYIHRYPLSNAYIQSIQYFENPFAHPSVMIQRIMLDQLEKGYSAEFPYVEDWELWSRLTKVGAGANIPEPLIQYRIHSLSSSRYFIDFQHEGKKRLLAKIYAEAGLPYRPEFLIDFPRSEVQWLHSCYDYYRELQKCLESSGQLDLKISAETLQQQLIQRVKQMAWLGIYPAFFILSNRISNENKVRMIEIALRVLIITNVRVLLALRDKWH